MKIILLRDKGVHRSVQISRSALAMGLCLCISLFSIALASVTLGQEKSPLDDQVLAQWQQKLQAQRAEIETLQRASQAQSAAAGRLLASMQARLMRMEAIGAHLADAADLQGNEFDFSAPPAQGGPVAGHQRAMDWVDLDAEIAQLSHQLKRRELELNILDQVLVNEEITSTSTVRGRPVTWGWMSSPFGKRVDPISGKNAWHSGVDFAGRDGSDVIAVASGVVTFAGERSGYGKMVEISHANGYLTRYAHHQDLLVESGDVVKKGEVI
jgi:murein DD-endopeptidase MepM/ murein hydrolase activator NlpD